MNLRTPRRRISPRTRRKYRAIREFFRRALGSSSQPDIKISSSIAVNVTDLKRKIIGLEQQLDEVNKHCQNISYLDYTRSTSECACGLQADASLAHDSDCCLPVDVKHEIKTISEKTESPSDRRLSHTETKLLYKSSNAQCGKSSNEKSQESEHIPKVQDEIDATQIHRMIDDYGEHVSKVNIKKSKLNRLSDYGAKLHKYRTRSVYENFASANSSSSFRSLINPRLHHSSPAYTGQNNDMKYLKQEFAEPVLPHYRKEKKHKERARRSQNDVPIESYEQKPITIRKHKHHNRELDQDFIADIIRRQYRPVKMFGKKQSDFSQISAPVCRDQEFSIRENIQEGTELCSCCYDEHKHRKRHGDLGEMRSICDTRLYSSKKHTRGKHRRGHVFNDSDVYDFIPVKEKSSPKTRRKFTEVNDLPYEYYKEVPPSPRTLRPRLNLKSQYNSEYEDYIAYVKQSCKKGSPRRRIQRERIPTDSDVTSVQVPNYIKEQPRKMRKHTTLQSEKQGPRQKDNATMSSFQYVPHANDQVNVTVDTTFNKPEETIKKEIPVDKTDKALCEIKDILQSFLHEIKKETIGSQCDKSDASSKAGDNGIHLANEQSAKLNGSPLPNSRRHSINNFGAGCSASPYMTSFQNPCCYPMMPVCPMNYPMTMPNGYMMPSQSYTCANCINTTKESVHENCCTKNTTTSCQAETSHTETENLIKEIYKFVAQSPVKKRDLERSFEKYEARKAEAKLLTSRSVGESSRYTNSKHDVKVGTPPLKCYSKSCEAIGSRMGSEPYISATNPSYSDTLLEKLSLQVTQSTSETELETTTTEDKSKRKTFSNVLRSIGLLKKKKKDVIEELSESESVIDVEVKQRSPRASHNPYRQDIMNYMMQGPEYYHPPPMPSNYGRPNEYQPEYNPAYNPPFQPPYNPPYNPGLPDYGQPPPLHDIYAPRAQPPRREQATAPSSYPSKHRPTAPPLHTAYDSPYKPMQQPPLCLKEIEVKSTGTQSERKFSIFRKIKKKMKPPADVEVDYHQNTCSTQTQASQPQAKPTRPLMKPLINWKKLQAKAMAEHNKLDNDPMKFSLKTERELADGDLKLRNAMLKKLFYKRNPFSPRNLIVRTLLGKDKSSYGEPMTKGLRPRMFLTCPFLECTSNMSREDITCPGVCCKKRFKGIENFLKRVAFNLGNTPSQTEVKIISCIPIDVTDLQQKIIHLEKQLEDATCALETQPPEASKTCKSGKFPKLSKSGCHRAVVESNFSIGSSAAAPRPSSDSAHCSSPDACPACSENKGKSNVSFAFPSHTNTTPAMHSTYNSDVSQGSGQAAKPNKMDQYYNQPVRPNMDYYYNQAMRSNNMNRFYNQAMRPNNVNQYYNQALNPNDMAHYHTTPPQMCDPQPSKQRQKLFKKKKKILKTKKVTSPYVYYAQTYSSPFIKSNVREEGQQYERESSNPMTRSYLAEMVSKQYKPELLGDNVSQQSEFSSPICRDVHPQVGMPCEGSCRIESDICSCCHGQFHNLDVNNNKQNILQTYMLHEMNAGSAFYDTNQYDLVPVKEKPVKIKKDFERPAKKEPRALIDMKCWPGNIRTKYRYHFDPMPLNNYYSTRPRDDYTVRNRVDNYGRKMPVTCNRTEPITRILAKRRKDLYRKERSINIETSRSCSIDFGNVYPKKSYKRPKKLESLQRVVPKKNAECLTTVINNSECQTEMSNVEVAAADNKTEATLNQIKSILQSVLAEVKESSQTKGQVIENKTKKDAVVQKGASRNNLQASSFMNSITYSPYAMNMSPSPYMQSCSRQMSPGSQFYCPHGGMKCFHNFPVFIQSPGVRHMCSNCYRSSQVKPSVMRRAATTATNTDVLKESAHSQETEKLIKEIYKSMALTMDFPNNTSLSEYDETMKSVHDLRAPIVLKAEQKKQQPKTFKNVVQAVSELFMKKDMMETSETFNTTIESKLPSHEVSMRSHVLTSTDTELRARKDRLESYMRAKNKQPVVHEANIKTFREATVQNANSYSESELSSSEPETETTLVGHAQQTTPIPKHVVKKGKEGLLTKMFKSVKLFKTKEKPKKRVEKSESEEEVSSDSDDYQTVYSQKIEKNSRQRSRPHNLPKRRTHSKISYKQAYQRDRSPEKKRSPYMEQENRRHWEEKLMFQTRRPRYSERQYSSHSTPHRPYYQSYEARPVLVEPGTHVAKTEPKINRGNETINKSILKPAASKGMAWLKKHKMGIHCGEQWKKFILES
ncbi:hypothetical protein PYW07_004193 [Mythimna separata]|uniref:Uncharacterized protein n=1 Tax=Mythimna separata TaxID=271217 RepID=A0AAD8DU01_MYTSE|nr:hypothetical protein PYW07_004193 [Mythimna separata]